MSDADLAAALAVADGPTYGLTERGAATIRALVTEVERQRRALSKISVLARAAAHHLREIEEVEP